MLTSLKYTSLVMVVGPAAIGKTTLMNEVASLDGNFAYVRSFTTRQQRANDTSHYSFITREEAMRLRDNNETVTFFEHTTTGDIYGTTAASFPARYNLLDTLSTTVETYRHLPFASTIVISLTANAHEWRSWFLSRYPTPSDDAIKRLKEAEQSIAWSLRDTSTHWLLNPAGKTETTARQLITLATQTSPPSSPPVEAERLLALIRDGIY